jgi:hypothetical protein
VPTRRDSILNHLQAQYDAWAVLLYPAGRSERAAELRLEYSDGTSGYSVNEDVIVLYVPEYNEEDFDSRFGNVRTEPDKWKLTAPEIELLHEMLHERQYKHTPEVTSEGRNVFHQFARTFDGAGHDERFFTAIATSATLLNVSPEQLVRNI